MTSPTRTVRGAVTPYRIVASVLLAVAVVGVGWAFSEHREVEDPTFIDSAVVHVEPGSGEQALRQDRIYVELQPNFTGVLIINGVEIPEDQLDRTAGVHTVGYTPGEDRETGALDPGVVQAKVVFWDLKQSRDESRSYEWTFDVS